MKQLFFLVIALFICMAPAASAADNDGFTQSRTVIIAETTQQGRVARYMAARLHEPFRFPYYQQKELDRLLEPEDINSNTLKQLSTEWDADIVLVPVVQRWYWREYMPLWLDERIDEYNYLLSVYVYDRKLDTFQAYSVSDFDRQEASVLTEQTSLLHDAMDALLKKLPYKRIPADRVKTSVEIPDWFHAHNGQTMPGGVTAPVAI